MVYTDGKILMADTDDELHAMARKLGLNYEQLACYPFSCYHLKGVRDELLDAQNIHKMSPAEALYRYHAVRKFKICTDSEATTHNQSSPITLP